MTTVSKVGVPVDQGVSDFLRLRYGFYPGTMRAIYDRLERDISQHVDDLVLLVARRERLNSRISLGRVQTPRDQTIETHLFLGVLKGEALILSPDGKTCEFPTGNHARCLDVEHGIVELIEANLAPPGFRDIGLNLNVQLKPRNVPGPISGRMRYTGLEVVIGADEVGTWFEDDDREMGSLEILERMLQLLKAAGSP